MKSILNLVLYKLKHHYWYQTTCWQLVSESEPWGKTTELCCEIVTCFKQFMHILRAKGVEMSALFRLNELAKEVPSESGFEHLFLDFLF